MTNTTHTTTTDYTTADDYRCTCDEERLIAEGDCDEDYCDHCLDTLAMERDLDEQRREEERREEERAVEAIEDAYDAATGTWDGASWDHVPTSLSACCDPDHAARQRDDDRGCETCRGTGAPCGMCSTCLSAGPHDDCDVCRDAESDARAAEEHAAEALAAAKRGDWVTAEREAAEARRLEDAHGDSPAWGPFHRIIEALA